MLESSRDILNLVIAFCVLWFTVFLCWFIYYIISTVKKVHDSINFFQKILSSTSDLIEGAKNKIHDTSNSLKFAGMLIEKGFDLVNKKIKNKNKTKSTASSKKKTRASKK